MSVLLDRLKDPMLDECALQLLRNVAWGVGTGLLPALVTRRPRVLLTTSSVGFGYALGATSRDCSTLLKPKGE